MENRFTSEERQLIRESISRKYSKVAVNPEGNFKYPTGRAGLEGLKYPPEILKTLPEEVLAFYCGVGNPFSLGAVARGDAVLDVGCGAGVDSLVAAMMAGREGSVVGVDFIPEMIDRARENLRKASVASVSFREASAEDLPFPDESFHLAISNGVFNLVPDKPRALGEVLRVLKPQGRLMLADQVLRGAMPVDRETLVRHWHK